MSKDVFFGGYWLQHDSLHTLDHCIDAEIISVSVLIGFFPRFEVFAAETLNTD